jgi:hypothetical protein
VAIGFAKPARFYGHTITTRDELLSVSSNFKVQSAARDFAWWPGSQGL